MIEIVTLYFSMFRQNVSGSNCGMITTGNPTISAKGSNMTAPGILLSQLPIGVVNQGTHQKCGRMEGYQSSRPFLYEQEGTPVGS